MKKLKIAVIIIAALVLIIVIGFKCFSAITLNEAKLLNENLIDVTQVADGTYAGHSEMGPVLVNVEVSVKDGRLTEVRLLEHRSGMGQKANSIVASMQEKGTHDVDAISGATISSEIIINAVNDALKKGI